MPEVPTTVTLRRTDGRQAVRRALRRAVLVLALALATLFTSAGAALAAPVDAAGPTARPGGGGGGGGGPKDARGFDISWPQCESAFPADPAFGIVGVNRGIVFSENPCLASQITWAGGTAGELYINTANPGPALSSYWPIGQTAPRYCDPANPDSADCAYDYGWNAAAASFQIVVAAYDRLGLVATPTAAAWWLDVETSNTWRQEPFALAFNVAALAGQVDYLRSIGVARIGFYSTTSQWGEITGGTTAFADYPSWGAGAPNERVAKRHCQSTPGFTGGPLAMVQYPWAGFDADLRC